MSYTIENEIGKIVEAIVSDYHTGRTIDKNEVFNQPNKDDIIDITNNLLKVVYPGYYRNKTYKIYSVDSQAAVIIEDVMYHLNKQIALALQYTGMITDSKELSEESQRIAIEFFKKIPQVRAILETDLQAGYDGDPAAKYKEEILMSYPGMLAITVNRLAHELFLLNVPLIPRIMTEYAHSITGIDIHPGATIGKYFFIDHGTGIVVGETTVIGDNVKIYQGVTLGALSTRGGQKLKGTRRHPTIEDNVTIYSGASILGGETVIGKNSVIGSNAFITASIPADTRVSIKNQELKYKQGAVKEISVVDLEQSDSWFYVI